MKNKILSIALVLGILLGLSSGIPASAENIAAKSLPYAFYDCEDGVVAMQGGTIVDGGMGGSAKCMSYTETSQTYTDCLIYSTGSAALTGELPAEHKLTMTFYLKLAQKLTLGKAMLMMYYNTADAANRFEVIGRANFDKSNITGWQKVTFEFTPENDREITKLYLRFAGDGTQYNLVEGGSPTDPRTYYMDEMEITVRSPESMAADNATFTLEDYKMDFENGAAVQINVSSGNNQNATNVPQTNGNETIQLVKDPLDNNNTVLKITLASSFGGAGSTLRFSSTKATGTNANRATGIIPAGSTITYKFRYCLGQEVRNEPNYTPKFCVANLTTTNRFASTTADFGSGANQWYTTTLTYKNNTGSAETINNATLRFCGDYSNGNTPDKSQWTVVGHEGNAVSPADYGERVIYFDDFRIFITADGQEPPAPESSKIPVSKNLRVTGEFKTGEQVTFTQEFTGSTDTAQDASVIKITHTDANGVKVSLGNCKIGDTLTIPAIPNDGTVKIEVVPIDSENAMGKATVYSIAQVAGQEIKLSLSEFEDDGSITATVNIDNQRFDGKAINAVLIVEMLNEYGMVVKYDRKPIVCANGSVLANDAGSLTLLANGTDLSEVVCARAFIWDCGDAVSPTLANCIMDELASDVYVEK